MVILRPVAGVILLNQLRAASLEDPAILEHSNWLVSTSTFWIIFLMIASLSVYAGLRLWQDRTPGSVKMAIATLWIYSSLAAVDIMIAKTLQQGQVSWPEVAQTIATNLAVAAVWTAYLLRSRRVRNTYHQPTGG